MFMPGGWEWIVILVIVLILFGPSQLPKLSKMIGDSIRSLKKASSGEDDGGPSTPSKKSESGGNHKS